MALLWQSGRRDEALRQYDVCRWILNQEIGVPPSPETIALHEAILDGKLPRRKKA
jgi:DNA-binding SARP family transcriptional activator